MRPVHLVPAGVVLLVLAAIGGVAQLDHPAASASPAATTTRQLAVTSVARACPPALGGGSGTVALIAGPAGSAKPAASTSAAAPASAAPGQAELTPLPPAGLQPRPARRLA